MTNSIIIALIVAIPPTIAAMVSLIVALSSRQKIEDLHIAVNSRLTQLLEQTAKASKAEGVKEGTVAEQLKK